MVRPLVCMTAAMKRLAAGQMDIEIPSAGRKDEIRSMAEAVGIFRRQSIEAEQLRQQQEAIRRASEAEKQAALLAMADTVDRETRRAVDAVSHLTEQPTASMREISLQVNAARKVTLARISQTGECIGARTLRK
ncbi:MAG TPA: HAMP domain-containing protein [Dongiaceae bacterium]|nr:HAMP domain-containing protein [Dongiaceae bacterium]